MKLVCEYFEDIITFEEGLINSLVVENPVTMRELVKDFCSQTEGGAGSSVLSINDKPCDFKTTCEVITSFTSFDINKKVLLNRIIALLEKTAMDEDHYYQTQQIIASIEKYVEDISFVYEGELDFPKLSVGGLLKSIGICFKDSYDNLLEKLIDYFMLVREFENDKLFILVNMRSYFNYEELELFAKTIIDHKLNILLIDNTEYRLLNSEKRIIIDEDKCVFNRCNMI